MMNLQEAQVSPSLLKAAKYLESVEGNGKKLSKEYSEVLGFEDVSGLRVIGGCYLEAVIAYSGLDSKNSENVYNCGLHCFVDPKDPIKFSEGIGKSEKAKRLIVYLLQSGSKAYTGNIYEISPEPSESNNYLWDKEAKAFRGHFTGQNGIQIEFELVSLGNDRWRRNFRLADSELAK